MKKTKNNLTALDVRGGDAVDNQIIQHEKYDAKRTYKKTTGYFPRAVKLFLDFSFH